MRDSAPQWQLTKSSKQGFMLSAMFLVLALVTWLGVALAGTGRFVVMLAVGWSVLGLGYLASSLALLRRTGREERPEGAE